MPRKITKILSIFLCLCLLFDQVLFAQTVGPELNLSGLFQGLSKQASQDKFRPLHLRYLSYNDLENGFELFLDKGDFEKGRGPEELKAETKKIMDYFFIAPTLLRT
jgi:hypothetical protein